jgi:hypothetical protein
MVLSTTPVQLLKNLRDAFHAGKVQWQKHALAKMLERGISREMVKQAVVAGELIEYYPMDRPLPSCLILGGMGHETIHVVAAIEDSTGTAFVITAYFPDTKHFMSDLKTRR